MLRLLIIFSFLSRERDGDGEGREKGGDCVSVFQTSQISLPATDVIRFPAQAVYAEMK